MVYGAMAGRLGGKFMEHKIVSEYDRIRPENSFPMEHDPTPDLSRYSASKPPRLWLPRRALALAALVLVLTTLAAALWPENLKSILHRNRDVSQMGVPIGVPEASSAPLAPSPVTTTVTKTAPSSTEIAANTDASEPEPPTEGRNGSAAAPADSASGQASVTPNTNTGADNPSNNAATESASTEAKVAAKPKPSTSSTTKRRSAAISRRTRGAQTPLYESDNVLPPRYPGSFRSRVVGTTPDGRLVLLLPSGETAVVEPRRRHERRIFMERRERYLPPLQPFDPTFPPVD
jgi:hypothetical protein